MSAVFIGYRRPDLLRRTVESLLGRLCYPRLELILADDGSPPEMQEAMRELPFHRCLFGPNGGLGANSNRGLRAASGDYILHLQDDFEFVGPSDLLMNSILALEEHPDIGIIRYFRWSELRIDEVRPPSGNGGRCIVFARDQPGTPNPFLYSDTPHLKRAGLHRELGWFRERRSMQSTELEFSRRFNVARRFRVGAIEGTGDAFLHTGTGERSHRRPDIRTRIGGLIQRTSLGRQLRSLVRRTR